MKYLTNTFSPLMIKKGGFKGYPISLSQAKEAAKGAASACSHKMTAHILSELLRTTVEFNRIDLELIPGDEVVAVCPKFRAQTSREFTHEEIVNAEYQAFIINILDNEDE